jgi:phosphatidate phosphatase APP1
VKVPRIPGLSYAADKVDLVKVVDGVDKAINAGAVEIKRRRQSLRPTVVVTYRGWYANGVAHMHARAIEKPVVAAGDGSAGVREVLRSNMRRFTVLTIPGITVRASMGRVSQEVTSDADGYLTVELEVGDLTPGWHVVDIDPVGDSNVPHTTGRVFVPDPRGGLAVVSDIDDTILKTGLTQRWTAAGRTFLRDVAQRKPVPGMSTFYAGLERGADGQQSVPFYYVSTGSWNLYDYLVAFMNLNRFPRGPLFLTDWGPNQERLVRDGREHKRASIRGLLQANPNHEWVFIGDVGQGDPETYEVMAREFPGQVKAIFLIYVGSHLPERIAEVSERANRLRDEGIPMYYVDNALEAAIAAHQLGLVDLATTTTLAREASRR